MPREINADLLRADMAEYDDELDHDDRLCGACWLLVSSVIVGLVAGLTLFALSSLASVLW